MKGSVTKVYIIRMYQLAIIWLVLYASKMKLFLCSYGYFLPTQDFQLWSCKKIVTFVFGGRIANPLLFKLLQSRWLNIGLVLFWCFSCIGTYTKHGPLVYLHPFVDPIHGPPLLFYDKFDQKSKQTLGTLSWWKFGQFLLLGIWASYVYYTFLGNCPPTPPLSQHFALSQK